MTSSTDITQYCTVRSWYMRKRIDHLCSVVPEKSQPEGPTFQWETRLAEFPTGTLGPRVGIFLSPLNTNDGFYLSHIPVPARGKDQNEQPHVGRTLAARRSVTSCIVKMTSPFRISANSGFSGSLFHIFPT